MIQNCRGVIGALCADESAADQQLCARCQTPFDLRVQHGGHAMAAGLPVICLDHQGAADIVTAESGMKVPVTTPAQVVQGLADAIEVLARDVNRRQQLSQGAWERAQLHTWDALGSRMTEIYRQVLVDVQSTAELKELSEVQPRAPQPVGPGAM